MYHNDAWTLVVFVIFGLPNTLSVLFVIWKRIQELHPTSSTKAGVAIGRNRRDVRCHCVFSLKVVASVSYCLHFIPLLFRSRTEGRFQTEDVESKTTPSYELTSQKTSRCPPLLSRGTRDWRLLSNAVCKMDHFLCFNPQLEPSVFFTRGCAQPQRGRKWLSSFLLSSSDSSTVSGKKKTTLRVSATAAVSECHVYWV